MVDAARKLLAGRRNVDVQWGDVAALPFRARSFDRAMTVNALYYWPDLIAGLREIARVLKPRGKLAVGFRSPLNLLPFTFTWSHFKSYEPEEVAAAMREAGFNGLQVEHRDKWRIPDTVVVVGERDRRLVSPAASRRQSR
jgi:SAM-dependent methyltransferase